MVEDDLRLLVFLPPPPHLHTLVTSVHLHTQFHEGLDTGHRSRQTLRQLSYIPLPGPREYGLQSGLTALLLCSSFKPSLFFPSSLCVGGDRSRYQEAQAGFVTVISYWTCHLPDVMGIDVDGATLI